MPPVGLRSALVELQTKSLNAGCIHSHCMYDYPDLKYFSAKINYTNQDVCAGQEGGQQIHISYVYVYCGSLIQRV